MYSFESAIFDQKIKSYILDRNHPLGWPKGRFLVSLGFKDDEPEEVMIALQRQARGGLLAQTETDFGMKLQIDGPIISPTNILAQIRTIWYIRMMESVPRFVTFKPLRKML
jgi:hypothetical protein